MKTVLIDASSAILLHKAQLFKEMAVRYRFVMAGAVFVEITVQGRMGADAFAKAREAGNFDVVEIDRSEDTHRGLSSLHAGEMETILAYDHRKAHFIIMDDGRGARACRSKKIPYINALLCPGLLHLSGHIDAGTRQSAFEYLRKNGRYADDIIAYAQKATPRQLAPFFP